MGESGILIALGANLPLSAGGSPAQTVMAAMTALEARFSEASCSKLFKTPCFPKGAGPDYVNAAMLLKSNAEPTELLAELHGIEAQFERERNRRWGMRTLDLDLIACGDAVLPDKATQTQWRELPANVQLNATPDQVIRPPPRLQDRAFVLVPMAEVAPNWVHPVLGLSIQEMLEALPASDTAEIVAMDPQA